MDTGDRKPIFITGATGSIGSRLAARYSADGARLRLLMRDAARAERFRGVPGAAIVDGDLAHPESLRGCMDGCSLVYHCAAKLHGSDWAAYRAINVEGTHALVREAEKAGVERFVHLSTIGVYACSESPDVTEDHPWPRTDYPYFATKQAAERAVWDAARTVPIVIARVGDVYGPGQNTWTVDLVRLIQRGLLQPPTDHESGTFNPVYIDNLIDALMLLGHHSAAPGQVFNVVDGTPMSFSEYIRRLAAMTGRRVVAVPGFALKAAAGVLMGWDRARGREASSKPGDVDYLLHKSVINGGKLRDMLGWRPSVGEADAFRATREWLRSEGLLS